MGEACSAGRVYVSVTLTEANLALVTFRLDSVTLAFLVFLLAISFILCLIIREAIDWWPMVCTPQAFV